MLIAGIDAGASKTLAVLCDGEGRILSRKRGPGMALAGAPTQAQLEGLRSLLASLLHGQSGALDFAGMGLHGVDFKDEMEQQRGALAAALGLATDRVTLANDGVVALWGASPSPKSAILQLGSGVTGAWRKEPGQETLFDHLDAGGIFELRSEALKAARRMMDGRLEATPLLAKIEGLLGVKGKRALSDAWYRRQLPQDAVSRLPALVFEAWTEGDAAAASLVQRAADDYACSALAMARLSGGEEIYFGGGVIGSAPPAFLDLLREKIRAVLPAASVEPPRLGPDLGACLMAGFHAGLPLSALWEEKP